MVEVTPIRPGAYTQGSDQGPGLPPGGPGGTSGGMTEDAIKPRVDFLQSAFLWLAGAVVTITLAFITAILLLSNGMNARADKIVENVASLSRQIGENGARLDEENRRLDRIEAKIDRLLEQRPK